MEQNVKMKLQNFVKNHTGNCKILVIGDLMLDKYYYGEVTRISPEAPVPITHVTSIKETLGGAANVAHNLALLGCQTSIAGFIGDDHHGQILIEKLISRGVDYFSLVHIPQPTTTKIRVIGGHQQMIRLDFENAAAIEGVEADNLIENIRDQLTESSDIDAVIISDYGKGTCTENTCERIIKLCHHKNIISIVDPKGNQWNKYSGATFITPNLKELNDVLKTPVKNTDKDIERASRLIIKKYDIDGIIVTRSEHGLSLVYNDTVSHIKANAQEVFDVSGAGDTVIAVFALALAGKIDPVNAAYLANLAAGIVVAKLGTYAVSREELFHRLNEDDTNI